MQSKIDEKWEEQENNSFWKPKEKGDELMGEVIGIRETNYGSTFDIELADKTVLSTPSHKVLLNKMANVEKGDVVKIIYDGQELPKVKGHNATKLYRVMIRKE